MNISGFLQKNYLVNTYIDRKLSLRLGKGVYLYDENDNQYLDFMTNYGVNILGYNNLRINRALIDQINKLTTLHASFTNETRARAAARLVNKCGNDYTQVYFSNSGAEAIETALKFAVLSTGKKKFIVCDHGYHGKTLGALSATSGERYKQPFMPLLWDFVSIPFNDIESLNNVIDENTAGFIIEPIQGEGGIHVPDDNFLINISKICKSKKIMLIIDEIQTGMGRTGKFIASGGIAGDILCLGKGLAGGIPIGATIVTDVVANLVPKHIHSSTFGGNPLACAGIMATLDLLDKKTLTKVKNNGLYLLKELSLIKNNRILAVRGKGLMIGLVVKKDIRNKIMKQLQDEKILVIPAGDDVIRFLPSYIIQKRHIDLMIRSLNKIIENLD